MLGGDEARRAPVATAPARTIEYREIEKWAFPAGGHARIVVVDSTHRNEDDLRALGEQLRTLAARDRHSHITVFDSERAARQHRTSHRLGDAAHERWVDHVLANYWKNPVSGIHSITISPGGMDGDSPRTIEVKY